MNLVNNISSERSGPMSQQMNKNRMYEKCFIFIILLVLNMIPASAQDSGYIWIQKFNPGSSNLNDATIDEKALEFVDNLMKRNDIDIQFLGASDELAWRHAQGQKMLSTAWDEGKKLERASQLRIRYGRGVIGTTDEPVRGIKVVWGPKDNGLEAMNNRIQQLESMNDSLKKAVLASDHQQKRDFQALRDSLTNIDPMGGMTSIAEISTSFFDWEVESGLFYWRGGAHYDLMVPYVGLALKRESWGIELQGGFTPWSKSNTDNYGNRGDAFLMGTFNLFPKEWYEFKAGVFSGWKYLTNSDNWTMKVMGVTAGPNFHVKFLNIFAGYNIGRLSTLAGPDRWVHSASATLSFNFKLNKW